MRNLLALASALLLLSAGMNAQCDETTRRELRRAGAVFMLLDYALTHEVVCGRLRDDEYSDHYLTLNRGYDYKITAGCDGDCGDIDLKLFDENGNLVDSDVERDDNPIVSIAPRWTGRFRLRVIMEECRINPCRYGIAVYGK